MLLRCDDVVKAGDVDYHPCDFLVHAPIAKLAEGDVTTCAIAKLSQQINRACIGYSGRGAERS